MLYRRPEVISYSAEKIVEGIGPCQSSYALTLYCTPDQNVATGDGCVNDDGGVIYDAYYDYVGSGWTPEVNYRTFVGFDISSLSGKTVVSATLRIYQDSGSDDGYTYLGNVIVDRFNFGDSIGASDYDATPLSANIGTISTNSATEWKTLDVKSAVQSDITDGRTVSQFRIRHEDDTVGGSNRFEDFAKSSADDATGNGYGPQLVVTYN